MPQSDPSARRHPTRRAPSARPTGARAREVEVRRPYPTAPSTTRISPATPAGRRGHRRPRASTSAPTPATVWTAGPVPVELDTAWPEPIITKIVEAFSIRGGRVALLPWPSSSSPAPLTGSDRCDASEHPPGTGSAGALADALAAVEKLKRTGRVLPMPALTAPGAPGSRPFWAEFTGEPDTAAPGLTATADTSTAHGATEAGAGAGGDTDLIITSLRPQHPGYHGGDQSSDLVASAAARLLHVGGILVVLTHCDTSQGALSDPSGAVVASAQNADLLYLQHIVALHAPIRAGRLRTDTLTTEPRTAALSRTAAREPVAVPAVHRRVHSDLLVFAQPHDVTATPATDPGTPGAAP